MIRLLRLGGVLCFVGHGAFGVITKEAWIPYFATFGIDRAMAFRLMPVVGWMDIALGLSLMVTLRPALLAWMLTWTVFTASLRPLSGEPVWEMLERAGNFGVPLALLLLVWPTGGWRAWLAPARVSDHAGLMGRVRTALVVACALLLAGHGMLGVNAKPGLVANLATVLPEQAAALTPLLGGFELMLALAVLAVPSVALAVFIAVWKLATESLFLAAGAPYWEVVERGGSYIVPLAIALVLARHRFNAIISE